MVAIAHAAGFPDAGVSTNPAPSSYSATWVTVGDLAIITVGIYHGSGAAPTVTAVTSTKLGTWTLLKAVADTTNAASLCSFYAPITSTGADTITITYSGSVSTSTGTIGVDELTVSGGGVTYSVVTTGTTSATVFTGFAVYPSLLSATTSNPQAYWGAAFNGFADIGAGTTTGFSWNTQGNAEIAFNGSLASNTSYQPTAGGSHDAYDTIAAIIKASTPGTNASAGVAAITVSSPSSTFRVLGNAGLPNVTASAFGPRQSNSFTSNKANVTVASWTPGAGPTGRAGSANVAVGVPSGGEYFIGFGTDYFGQPQMFLNVDTISILGIPGVANVTLTAKGITESVVAKPIQGVVTVSAFNVIPPTSVTALPSVANVSVGILAGIAKVIPVTPQANVVAVGQSAVPGAGLNTGKANVTVGATAAPVVASSNVAAGVANVTVAAISLVARLGGQATKANVVVAGQQVHQTTSGFPVSFASVAVHAPQGTPDNVLKSPAANVAVAGRTVMGSTLIFPLTSFVIAAANQIRQGLNDIGIAGTSPVTVGANNPAPHPIGKPPSSNVVASAKAPTTHTSVTAGSANVAVVGLGPSKTVKAIPSVGTVVIAGRTANPTVKLILHPAAATVSAFTVAHGATPTTAMCSAGANVVHNSANAHPKAANTLVTSPKPSVRSFTPPVLGPFTMIVYPVTRVLVTVKGVDP